MLSAQAERLDRQFLARRSWPYATWRERYLDHPLVGTLARRLLWTVDGTPAGYADGALRTLTDDPVADGTEGHPLAPPSTASSRRDRRLARLAGAARDHPAVQAGPPRGVPAHRRRAHDGHVLEPVRGAHRPPAPVPLPRRGPRLARKLRLCVDDEAPPATRELPQWGLRAQYWIEGDGEGYGTDTTESGSYLRLRTDQVRFYPIGAPENSAHCYGGEYRSGCSDGADPVEPLPLTDVPPLVLSESPARRGPCSWAWPVWATTRRGRTAAPAAGPASTGRRTASGELNQSAETRRVLLERLVPLAVADRWCTIEGRFLHVKGELHTYKIHLGSGNILMTPDRPVPVHRPQVRRGAPPAGRLPPLRGRPDPGGGAQQGDDAGRRHEDHGPRSSARYAAENGRGPCSEGSRGP